MLFNRHCVLLLYYLISTFNNFPVLQFLVLCATTHSVFDVDQRFDFKRYMRKIFAKETKRMTRRTFANLWIVVIKDGEGMRTVKRVAVDNCDSVQGRADDRSIK